MAVLDWGLGHAARSIALIRELQRQGARLIIAGSGAAGLLLRRECPDIPYLECPAYAVHYRGRNMYLSMFRQLPKIFTAILREHLWLRQLVRTKAIDLIISDSRFGCFHPAVPSLILSHQLQLPLSPPWLSRLVNWLYHRILARFQAVWVPDQANGLSGSLSFPSPLARTRYIGCLSRLQPGGQVNDRYALLVLLSGPEPQRSFLETIILEQLRDQLPGPVLLVRGRPDLPDDKSLQLPGVEVVNVLAGTALQEALQSTEVVLCRSGYSSLMDLARLGKKAILVPTPGQPEQEYLAQRCRQYHWTGVQSQDALHIPQALIQLKDEQINGFPTDYQSEEDLTVAVHELLHTGSFG